MPLHRLARLAAALVGCAVCYVLELPVLPNGTGLDAAGFLVWDTEIESAEECVRNVQAQMGGEGVVLMVGMVTFHHRRVRAWPAKEQTFCPWTELPFRLHSLAAELVQPPEEALKIEEAAWAPSYESDVGMFLLLLPGRNGWRVLTHSLREVWARGILTARLHVLVHHNDDWLPDLWRSALGDALPLMRGLHWCGGQNRFSRFNERLVSEKPKDNYYHKVFTMLALAHLHSYKYLVSMDDDVLLPPSALAFLMGSGPQADNLGCGIVTPLLQNGLPSVELWAEEFLSQNERKYLYSCFGESSANYCDEPYPELEPVPTPWDGYAWYKKVREAKQDHHLAHKGLHPVRGNNSCMEIALGLALGRLQKEWPRWREDHVLYADTHNIYPYFCNNAYLIRTDLYEKVIYHPDLRLGGADEQKLNTVLDDESRPKCFISGSFGIHPAYSTHQLHLAMENTAVASVLQLVNGLDRDFFVCSSGKACGSSRSWGIFVEHIVE